VRACVVVAASSLVAGAIARRGVTRSVGGAGRFETANARAKRADDEYYMVTTNDAD
jgi:hypothetical protein